MKIQKAKHLAKLEGQAIDIEQRLTCPECNKRTAMVKWLHDNVYCYKCQTNWNGVNQFVVDFETMWKDEKKEIIEIMESQPGFE